MQHAHSAERNGQGKRFRGISEPAICPWLGASGAGANASAPQTMGKTVHSAKPSHGPTVKHTMPTAADASVPPTTHRNEKRTLAPAPRTIHSTPATAEAAPESNDAAQARISPPKTAYAAMLNAAAPHEANVS